MWDYNFFRPHLSLDGKVKPASVAKARPPFFSWEDVARSVDAVGRVPNATRPKERPGFKPKRKLGRRRSKPRGRKALEQAKALGGEGRPIGAPRPRDRKRKAAAYAERLPTQLSLNMGKR